MHRGLRTHELRDSAVRCFMAGPARASSVERACLEWRVPSCRMALESLSQMVSCSRQGARVCVAHRHSLGSCVRETTVEYIKHCIPDPLVDGEFFCPR